MDLPSIDGFNTWLVARLAREEGLKVALSGLGGDELFGGYSSFRDVPRWRGRARAAPPHSRPRRGLARPSRGAWRPGRPSSRASCATVRASLVPTPCGARSSCRTRWIRSSNTQASPSPGFAPTTPHSTPGRSSAKRCSATRRVCSRTPGAPSTAWNRRSISAINCCATATGPAWRTASRSACRWSTPGCAPGWSASTSNRPERKARRRWSTPSRPSARAALLPPQDRIPAADRGLAGGRPQERSRPSRVGAQSRRLAVLVLEAFGVAIRADEPHSAETRVRDQWLLSVVGEKQRIRRKGCTLSSSGQVRPVSLEGPSGTMTLLKYR